MRSVCEDSDGTTPPAANELSNNKEHRDSRDLVEFLHVGVVLSLPLLLTLSVGLGLSQLAG